MIFTFPRCAKFALLAAVLSASGTPVRADHTALGFGVGTVTSSAINTESAVPLPTGYLSFSARSQYIDLEQVDDRKLFRLLGESQGQSNRDLHSLDGLLQTALSIAYGITDDVTVGVRIPYIHRFNIREPFLDPNNLTGEPEITRLGDVEGFGDLTAFGQYRFWKDEDTQQHAALILGVQMPTGRTNVFADDILVEAHLQPSSSGGAWQGLAGLAYTKGFGSYTLNSSVLYTVSSDGTQKTDVGDSFLFNVALSYRAIGGPNEKHFLFPKGNAVDLVLELNGEWRDREHIANLATFDSGSTLVYVSPGVRYSHPSGFNVALSLGAPIVTQLNGFQVEPGYRVLGSFSYSFQAF